MNVFAFLAILFGTVAIIAVFISIIHYERAELLSESIQAHQDATKGLIRHCDALEAENRHCRACRAGNMLAMGVLDEGERMTIEGENVP